MNEVFKAYDEADAWGYIASQRVNTIFVEPLAGESTHSIKNNVVKLISHVRSKYPHEFVFVLYTNIQKAKDKFKTEYPDFNFDHYIKVNNDEEDTQYFDKLKLALEKCDGYLSGGPSPVPKSHPQNWWAVDSRINRTTS